MDDRSAVGMAADCIGVVHRVADDKAVGNLVEVVVDNQEDSWEYSSTC